MIFFRRIFIFMKRCFKHPLYMIMLFVLPVLVGFYRLTPASSKSAYIPVAIYDDDKTESSKALTDSLINSNHIFKFYEVNSLNELQDDIAKKKASFGYVFPKGLFESIAKDDFSNKIPVYKTTSSQLVKSANEIVFGLIFDISSPDRLAYYLSKDETLSEENYSIITDEIKNYYSDNRSSDSTFSIHDISSGKVFDMNNATPLNIPFLRIAGLMIFLSAFIGLFSFIIDRENKLFTAHLTEKKLLLATESIIAFTIPAYVVSIVSVIIADILPVSTVLFELSIYSVCMIFFSLILSFVIRKSTVFSKVLPVYIILMIIFGGIFFDVSSFSSTLGFIARFFPTSYL